HFIFSSSFTYYLHYILENKLSFYYQISQSKSGGWLIHEKFKFNPREHNFQGWKYYPLPLPMENSLNHTLE
ncbi:hypothetical protein LDENG_00181570, partial [Lucifuga dentata]